MDDRIAWYKQGPECTVAEAAEILGLSNRTVLRMCERRELISWVPSRSKRLLYRRQVESYRNDRQNRAIAEYKLVQSELSLFL